jgi:hypothetical protein
MSWISKLLLLYKRKKVQVLTNREIAMLLDAIDVGEKRITFFPFNEFTVLDDHAIQKVIKKTNICDIAMVALSIDSELRNKIFRNIPQQDSIKIKNIIKGVGNFKEKDIVEAQTKICSIIYYLANTGEIIIPKRFRFPDNLDQYFPIFHPPSSFDSISKYIEEFQVFLRDKRCEWELGELEKVETPILDIDSAESRKKFEKWFLNGKVIKL